MSIGATTCIHERNKALIGRLRAALYDIDPARLRDDLVDKGIMFGDGTYTGFTAWPSGIATLTGDGFLGIAPGGQVFTQRSLDFWRHENGMIRENWVLVDILDIYHQLGVDVFERMREVTADRQPAERLSL